MAGDAAGSENRCSREGFGSHRPGVLGHSRSATSEFERRDEGSLNHRIDVAGGESDVTDDEKRRAASRGLDRGVPQRGESISVIHHSHAGSGAIAFSSRHPVDPDPIIGWGPPPACGPGGQYPRECRSHKSRQNLLQSRRLRWRASVLASPPTGSSHQRSALCACQVAVHR